MNSSEKQNAGEIVLAPKNLISPCGDNHMETDKGSITKLPSSESPHPKRKLYLCLLLLATFLSYCSISVMAPFYPPETWKRGISETMTGMVFSFYSFIMFAMSPLFGIIIPKVGVKNAFIWGYLFAGLSNACFGALDHVEDATVFTALSFAIRGAEGLGTCAAENAAFVYISQLYPDDSNFARGLFETAVGLGFSSGPALGGLLYSVILLASVGGFGLPFYLLGGFAVLNGLLNSKVLPRLKESREEQPKRSLRCLLKTRPTVVCVLIIITTSTTMAAYTTTLESHLRKFQLRPEVLGSIFLVDTATYTIFTPLWGRLTDKMKTTWWLMSSGLMAQAALLLFLGPSYFVPFLEDSLWLNVAVLAGIGLVDGLVIIPSYKGIVDGALSNGFEEDKVLHGFVTGTWMCSYALGQVVGPALGGAVLEHFGFEVLSASLALISFVMSLASFASYVC